MDIEIGDLWEHQGYKDTYCIVENMHNGYVSVRYLREDSRHDKFGLATFLFFYKKVS